MSVSVLYSGSATLAPPMNELGLEGFPSDRLGLTVDFCGKFSPFLSMGGQMNG